MLYKDEVFDNGERILLWKMEESIEELLSNFSSLKSEYESTVASFRSPKRIQEFLSVRLLLQTVLGYDAQVIYDDNGKPTLSNAELKISISHTKDYAAVYVSPCRELGIDIEQMSDKIFRVKNKFLNEEECKAIDSTDKIQLLLCWSAKEAVYKLVPGLRPDYWEQVLVVDLSLEKQCMTLDVEGIGPLLLHFQVDEDFVMVYN